MLSSFFQPSLSPFACPTAAPPTGVFSACLGSMKGLAVSDPAPLGHSTLLSAHLPTAAITAHTVQFLVPLPAIPEGWARTCQFFSPTCFLSTHPTDVGMHCGASNQTTAASEPQAHRPACPAFIHLLSSFPP